MATRTEVRIDFSEKMKDPDPGTRRLAHYNNWLINEKKTPEERYPGFPEDVHLRSARQRLMEEYVEKKAEKAKEVKPKAEKKTAPKAKRAKSAPGESKQEKAFAIFKRIGDNKAVVIAAIQEECSMTPLGAQTYYYAARKHFATQGA